MRISDWSSDVCSSDLAIGIVRNRDHLKGIDADRLALDDAAPVLAVFFRPRCRTIALVHVDHDDLARRGVALPDPAIGTVHRSEEHTSELQSLMRISYAVFCLKKKKHKL